MFVKYQEKGVIFVKQQANACGFVMKGNCNNGTVTYLQLNDGKQIPMIMFSGKMSLNIITFH